MQVSELVDAMLRSKERILLERKLHERMEIDRHINNSLSLSRTKSVPRQIVMLGSCLLEKWSVAFSTKCSVEKITINNVTPPPLRPPLPPETYDFQIVQLPVRAFMREHTYMNLSFHKPDAYQELFTKTCQQMGVMLDQALAWNKQYGMPTLVCNFFVPQQNSYGRVAPRYDLRNFVYFFEKLNEELSLKLLKYENCYILDIERISASLGRQYHQSDIINLMVQQELLGDFDLKIDQNRIEKPTPPENAGATRKSKNFSMRSGIWKRLRLKISIQITGWLALW
jgi:hypothetical protein